VGWGISRTSQGLLSAAMPWSPAHLYLATQRPSRAVSPCHGLLFDTLLRRVDRNILTIVILFLIQEAFLAPEDDGRAALSAGSPKLRAGLCRKQEAGSSLVVESHGEL
jgi:hypothetical protein